MRIGYVSLPGRGDTDVCIAACVAELRRAGVRLAGTVQTNLERAKDHPCDMDLSVLPDGPAYRISQNLGPGARGCRLDSGVLDDTVVEASRHLDGADVLIINKSGRLDAEGRGFGPLIAEALERGIPVLVGVNGLNLPALERLAEGMAECLSADPIRIAHRLARPQMA